MAASSERGAEGDVGADDGSAEDEESVDEEVSFADSGTDLSGADNSQGSSDSSSPDSASPDSASPDSASPDSASPDSASADSASPDSASPDSASPDSASPDSASADSASADSASADSASPDSASADSASPDSASPDSASPDSASPDSSSPDSSSPDSSSPNSVPAVATATKKSEISLTLYGRTDVGQIREHNEDNFLIADLTAKWRGVAGGAAKTIEVGQGGFLMAVCDGMGGAAAGEVASQLATDIVYDKMLGAAGHFERDQLALDIVEALEDAGARILEESNSNRACRGMGTTATVAALVDNHLLLGQVGDSRAYILRGGRIVQVTRDQSLVNQLIEAGQLTEEEAENFEHSNIILQALGTADAVQVDLTYAELRAGDVLMMCSDGLSGMIRDHEICDTLLSITDPVEACRVLIDDANQAGGHDNITVIVAVFDGRGLSPPTSDDIELLKYTKYTLPAWVDDRAGTTQRVESFADAGYDDTPTIEITGELEVDLRDNWAERLFDEHAHTPMEEPPDATNLVIWVAVAVLVIALYYLIAR